MYTFPALTTEETTLAAQGGGSRIKAIRAYYNRARVTLPNGHEVGPTLTTAKNVAYLTAEGLDIPVIVSEGSYIDYTVKAEQDRVLAERFALFCIEDGLDPKNPVKAGSCSHCDRCGKKGDISGFFFYAPDAMGYPTQVFFSCDKCGV